MIPDISVIIPARNSEKTISKCLSSVINQNFKNYEIIAVDNNSQDKTKEIINGFMKKNKKIKYISEAKVGRGAARNAGIKSAKGKILVMIDSDCIAPKNWLREITKPIFSGKEEIVMGWKKDLTFNFWTTNILKLENKIVERKLNQGYASYIDTKNFAIKASLMKKYMFDSNLGNMEDFDLYLRVKNKVNIKFEPRIIVGHFHKISFLSLIRLNFDRSYWVYKIYKKNKNKYLNEPMFEGISLNNNLVFPFWILLQFFKMPVDKFYCLFVSEISWRIGLLLALFRK